VFVVAKDLDRFDEQGTWFGSQRPWLKIALSLSWANMHSPGPPSRAWCRFPATPEWCYNQAVIEPTVALVTQGEQAGHPLKSLRTEVHRSQRTRKHDPSYVQFVYLTLSGDTPRARQMRLRGRSRRPWRLQEGRIYALGRHTRSCSFSWTCTGLSAANLSAPAESGPLSLPSRGARPHAL